MGVRRQLLGHGSLLSPCRFQRSNSHHRHGRHQLNRLHIFNVFEDMFLSLSSEPSNSNYERKLYVRCQSSVSWKVQPLLLLGDAEHIEQAQGVFESLPLVWLCGWTGYSRADQLYHIVACVVFIPFTVTVQQLSNSGRMSKKTAYYPQAALRANWCPSGLVCIQKACLTSTFSYSLEIASHVTQAGIKFAIQPRMTLNFSVSTSWVLGW